MDIIKPLVLVTKKDNKMRICIDNRRLNKKTVREHFSLPVRDDVMTQMHSAEVFKITDLKNFIFP